MFIIIIDAENPVYARTTPPAAVPSPPSMAKKPTQTGQVPICV